MPHVHIPQGGSGVGVGPWLEGIPFLFHVVLRAKRGCSVKKTSGPTTCLRKSPALAQSAEELVGSLKREILRGALEKQTDV